MEKLDLTSKRILVTGATGFLGTHVVRRLKRLDANVVAIERTSGKGDHLLRLGVEVVPGDITDSSRMVELIDSLVDYVLHVAAALSGVPRKVFEAVNVQATENLARLSAEANVHRFIYISSIAVYGDFGDRDVDETYPLTEYGDPYGDSKIRSEKRLSQVVDSLSLSAVTVRPGFIYGPESPAWAIRLADWARRGIMPIVGDGSALAYPIYVDNLVDLILAAMTHPKASGRVYNGVDDGPVTMQQFLGGFLDMADTKRALRLPAWLARLGSNAVDPFVSTRNMRYIVNQMISKGQISNQKAKQDLGWQPEIALEEGLLKTELWLKAHGYL